MILTKIDDIILSVYKITNKELPNIDCEVFDLLIPNNQYLIILYVYNDNEEDNPFPIFKLNIDLNNYSMLLISYFHNDVINVKDIDDLSDKLKNYIIDNKNDITELVSNKTLIN